MLTCVPCTKQLGGGSLREPENEETIAAPSTKQAVKALTDQVKDMALKASGAYCNCKPCLGLSCRHQNHQNYAESETASASERFRCSYRRAGFSSSTPRLWGIEMEARLTGISSGEGTPQSVSDRTESFVFVDEDEPKEWVAQVEPGVLITFESLPQGGNDLKRIRFSREMFNKWRAQRWWTENYDKVMELYNVHKFNRQVVLPNPPKSEDESSKIESPKDSPLTIPGSPQIQEHLPPYFHCSAGMSCSSLDSLGQHGMQAHYYSDSCGLTSTPKLSSIGAARTGRSSMDASVRTSSSQEVDELSISNASDLETEWVEQDEPGVYITVRELPGGVREVRRIRFSREIFGEMQARIWWEENKARIREQYL